MVEVAMVCEYTIYEYVGMFPMYKHDLFLRRLQNPLMKLPKLPSLIFLDLPKAEIFWFFNLIN